MYYVLLAAALVRLAFLAAEMFPWGEPLLLALVSKKLPGNAAFHDGQKKLVATIVHNAAIYNGILAGGFLYAAWAGSAANDVARVLLMGATAAGIFGTITLRSPATAVQAAVGIAGLCLL